ncbi:hypothetical protein CDAR_244051 [Caerostris darwini]|uniref:Uncharacterized protein n=1 Tax=Caerostris darwini TaxID=1538125 RepID=A0AAV4RV37_9ARAC|nr:hypothetical protein CDAR_244051 [Caerostris darwini]
MEIEISTRLQFLMETPNREVEYNRTAIKARQENIFAVETTKIPTGKPSSNTSKLQTSVTTSHSFQDFQELDKHNMVKEPAPGLPTSKLPSIMDRINSGGVVHIVSWRGYPKLPKAKVNNPNFKKTLAKIYLNIWASPNNSNETSAEVPIPTIEVSTEALTTPSTLSNDTATLSYRKIPLGETLGSLSETKRNSSKNSKDYMDEYYEYPSNLLSNDTNYDDLNGTNYDVGNDYYRNYYDDFVDYYSYPEYYSYPDAYDGYYDSNASDNLEEYGFVPLRRPYIRHKREAKPKRGKARRHLCVKDEVQSINYTFECKRKDVQHFACINSEGLLTPCSLLKNKKKSRVHLCITKKPMSYITACKSPKRQRFCFSDVSSKEKLQNCTDESRRICFRGGLVLCSAQGGYRSKKQATPTVSKPVVHCQFCEVDVKMVMNEDDKNVTPSIQIEVHNLDPLERLMDSSPEDDK